MGRLRSSITLRTVMYVRAPFFFLLLFPFSFFLFPFSFFSADIGRGSTCMMTEDSEGKMVNGMIEHPRIETNELWGRGLCRFGLDKTFRVVSKRTMDFIFQRIVIYLHLHILEHLGNSENTHMWMVMMVMMLMMM